MDQLKVPSARLHRSALLMSQGTQGVHLVQATCQERSINLSAIGSLRMKPPRLSTDQALPMPLRRGLLRRIKQRNSPTTIKPPRLRHFLATQTSLRQAMCSRGRAKSMGDKILTWTRSSNQAITYSSCTPTMRQLKTRSPRIAPRRTISRRPRKGESMRPPSLARMPSSKAGPPVALGGVAARLWERWKSLGPNSSGTYKTCK